MGAPATQDTTIDNLAKFFSSKRSRVDLDPVLWSQGVRLILPKEKYAKLLEVFASLYRSQDLARLASVIDSLVNVHALEPKEIEELVHYKTILGIGRVASIDLGLYGSLSVDSDTKRMVRAYATLRALENKLREFIDFKLRLGFGDKWWQTNTSDKVKEAAERARAPELESPWQSINIGADIYYTEFKHLKSIVTMDLNWPEFKEIFIDEVVTFKKLQELEVVRNIIAHSRTLSTIELERLELYAHNILKLIGAIRD